MKIVITLWPVFLVPIPHPSLPHSLIRAGLNQIRVCKFLPSGPAMKCRRVVGPRLPHGPCCQACLSEQAGLGPSSSFAKASWLVSWPWGCGLHCHGLHDGATKVAFQNLPGDRGMRRSDGGPGEIIIARRFTDRHRTRGRPLLSKS